MADDGLGRIRQPGLVFYAVDKRGRTLSGAYASSATLAAIMRRDKPGRRYEVRVGRGQAKPYRPEVHEARGEPGLHVVTPSPPAQHEQEVAPG